MMLIGLPSTAEVLDDICFLPAADRYESRCDHEQRCKREHQAGEADRQLGCERTAGGAGEDYQSVDR